MARRVQTGHVETLNTRAVAHCFILVTNKRIYIILLSNRTALLPEFRSFRWYKNGSKKSRIYHISIKESKKISTSFEHKVVHIWNNLIQFLLQFIWPLTGAHGDQLAGTGSRSVCPRRPPCQHHRISLLCCFYAARARGPPTGSDRMATATTRAAWHTRIATVTTTVVAEVCFSVRERMSLLSCLIDVCVVFC